MVEKVGFNGEKWVFWVFFWGSRDFKGGGSIRLSFFGIFGLKNSFSGVFSWVGFLV
jgi:hypothetical protein